MKREGFLIVFIFLLIVFFSFSASAAPIVINHTSVDLFDKIPQRYLDEAKKMWIYIPGESHSYAYVDGLIYLYQQTQPVYGDKYKAINSNVYTNTSLRTTNSPGSGEANWYTWYVLNTTQRDYIKNLIRQYNSSLTAIGFGWCWDMTWLNGVTTLKDPVYGTGWAGSSVGGPDGGSNGLQWGLDDGDYSITGNRVSMDTYLNATEDYMRFVRANKFNVSVLFTTGPVDDSGGTEAGYQRELKHQYIRNYVNKNESRVLFDYADILSWNDSGQEYRQNWTNTLGNIVSMQVIHPNNMQGSSTGHIGSVGAIRLAKAEWVLAARLAGWDGNSQSNIYYVSTNGNDNNPGTDTSPFRTIQKCANTVVSGGSCIVNTGYYNETVNVRTSGNPNSKINFTTNGLVKVDKILVKNSSYIVFDGFNIGYNKTVLYRGVFETDSYSHDIILRNSIIDPYNIHTTTTDGAGGIILEGYNNLVDNCSIRNITSWTAVEVLGLNNTVSNSLISECNDADAFRVYGVNNKIVNNTVTKFRILSGDNHADFIQTFGNSQLTTLSHHILVENNLIFNAGVQPFNLERTDGATNTQINLGIHNWTFRNNIFSNLSGYGSSDLPDLFVYNNIFYHTGGNGAVFGIFGKGSEIINNVFLDCGVSTGFYNPGEYGWYFINASNVKADYNYIAGPSYANRTDIFGSKLISETHGITGMDSQFVDLNSNNFRLKSSSPLLDKGFTLTSFSDREGVLRPIGNGWDIGAYEYNSTNITITNYHPAESDGNNRFLSSIEIKNYIQKFLSNNSVNLVESLYALTLYQKGGNYSTIGNSNCSAFPWNCWTSI